NLIDQPFVLLRWLLNDRQPGWHGGDQPVPITFMLLTRVAVVTARCRAGPPNAVRAFGCLTAIVLVVHVVQFFLARYFLAFTPCGADQDKIIAALRQQSHFEGFAFCHGLYVSLRVLCGAPSSLLDGFADRQKVLR